MTMLTSSAVMTRHRRVLQLVVLSLSLLVVLAGCSKRVDLRSSFGEDDAVYVQDHEDDYIDEIFTIYEDKNSTDEQRIELLRLASQMRSKRSQALLILGVIDDDFKIRSEAVRHLSWRISRMNDSNKSKLIDFLRWTIKSDPELKKALVKGWDEPATKKRG